MWRSLEPSPLFSFFFFFVVFLYFSREEEEKRRKKKIITEFELEYNFFSTRKTILPSTPLLVTKREKERAAKPETLLLCNVNCTHNNR